MQVLHVSTSDQRGGAARAAYRIHRSLLTAGLESRMLVVDKTTDDPTVYKSRSKPFSKQLRDKFKKIRVKIQQHGWKTENKTLHTFGNISAGLVEELNSSSADIINLHWISRMLSIQDIGRIKKPIIWTLHDMWPFCGGEHVTTSDSKARFRIGYNKNNRPDYETGPDLNRLAWITKREAWADQNFTIVAPSNWLSDCARQSVLFRNCDVITIANPLDTVKTWFPNEREIAKRKFAFHPGRRIVLAGADGGFRDPNKGGDLFWPAVKQLATHKISVELAIFGQSGPSEHGALPYKVHWLGHIHDDKILAQLYSAADVMVVPSRQEAFGQTASEAQACGTPVVAFDNSGLTDIVVHKKTGWLAKPYDVCDLAEGIRWAIDDFDRWQILSEQSRRNAVERFSEEIIANEYLKAYRNLLTQYYLV